MPGLLSLLGDDPSGPHADAAFKLQGAQFAHDSRDGIFSRMRLVHQIEQIVCGDVAVCFGASFNGCEYGGSRRIRSVDSCGCSTVVSSGRSTCCGRCAAMAEFVDLRQRADDGGLAFLYKSVASCVMRHGYVSGTANTWRLSSFAHPAVLSAPERARACATIRVDDRAAIRRLL